MPKKVWELQPQWFGLFQGKSAFHKIAMLNPMEWMIYFRNGCTWQHIWGTAILSKTWGPCPCHIEEDHFHTERAEQLTCL